MSKGATYVPENFTLILPTPHMRPMYMTEVPQFIPQMGLQQPHFAPGFTYIPQTQSSPYTLPPYTTSKVNSTLLTSQTQHFVPPLSQPFSHTTGGHTAHTTNQTLYNSLGLGFN